MKKFQYRNLLITLFGIIVFEFIDFHKKKVEAQFLNKNDFEQENTKLKSSDFDEKITISKFSNSNYLYKKEFIKVLKGVDNKINNFLAFDKNSPNQKFNLDIISDIQYQQNNKFYAEGNAVVYFSNATLKADLITFDETKKIFTADGNVIFSKGKHIIEGSSFEFNSKTGNGSFNDAYGILDLKNFNKDFDLKAIDASENIDSENYPNISDIEYINSTSIGLINKFESGKRFNITNLDFNVPEISRWRFKTNKLKFENSIIKSDDIYFTNDPLNKPQFVLQSKNFSGEIIDDKTKIISGNTWLILDNKIKFPIGRRKIFDEDPITRWGIGSDFEDRDGFYISRSFQSIDLADDLQLRLRPYYLIQRGLGGTTKSFRPKNASILDDKEKRDIVFGDNFGLDANLKGDIFTWDLDLKTSLNTLDLQKLSEAFRSKLDFKKTINLNPKKETEVSLLEIDLKQEDNFENYLDFKISSSFREKIYKGFSGEQEIYFGNSLAISNRKYWARNQNTKNLNFIYNFGNYTAKRRDEKKLSTLARNFVGATFNNRFPIWTKSKIDKNINSEYIYSPTVIKQGLFWNNEIKSGLFLYSNGSDQSAITLNTGPQLVLGSFKNNFFDYSKLSIVSTYIFKNGQSPFAFDDIDKTTRIRFNLEQQLLGPLVFTYDTYLNLDSENNDYGKFSKHKYGLDIKRRAYSIGAFYNTDNESAGINFRIYNFDFKGYSPSFEKK